ncbi:MAG TPA: ribosome recycling factor [Candidatus Eisenbacteria bacterium]|nr:ribosome recycling factor [Candidatus Eisenbacteria bacterium]
MTNEVIDATKKEMDATVAAFKKELGHVRTGRATTQLLDGIMVDYYGTRTPLNQVATLNVPEPTLIVIQPFDKTAVQAIEKAIHTSDLGLTPQNDGKLIRVPIPALTEQRRKDLVKHVKKVAEDYRVSMRNHRRDALEKLKALEKDKKITQDDHRHAHDKIEAGTKDAIDRLDKLVKTKEDEIMAV